MGLSRAGKVSWVTPAIFHHEGTKGTKKGDCGHATSDAFEARAKPRLPQGTIQEPVIQAEQHVCLIKITALYGYFFILAAQKINRAYPE